MEVTIRQILEELSGWVKNGEIHSPSEWIDKAQQLTALRQDLKDALTQAEIEFEMLVEKFENEGNSHARAVTKAKIHNNGEIYKKFRYLKARDEVVDKIVSIAKRRATIEI